MINKHRSDDPAAMSKGPKHSMRAALALLTLGVLVLPAPAFADIKCWQNDDGVRECGQIVPPEHSHRRIEVINERGVVVKVIEAAPTAEEIAEQERQAQLRKEQEARRAERARKDRVLLRSYTTEQDIIIARDNNLRAIESIIDITRAAVRGLRSALEDLKKRAANHERAGRQPPEQLLQRMDEVRAQIQSKQAYIDKKQRERSRMKEKFEADLERFRYLKNRNKQQDE